MQQAPDDEVPARAVPEAAEEEHGDQVDVAARRADAVAAERDVEVVAEPGRQRDVPAPPELLDACRRCTASGSSPGSGSRTSGRGRSPCPSSRRSRSRSAACSRRCRARRGPAIELRRPACAKILSAGPATTFAISTFLPRPMTKRRTPYGEVVERHDAPRELIGDVAVADDRPGDELRKEQQVERRVHRALLRRRVAAVDVDDVRDGVEGEERDADRQQHARHVERRRRRRRQSSALTLSAKKLAYLKTPRTTRLTATANASQRLRARRRAARAIDRDRHPVVERDRAEHQPGERAAALGVEDDAGDEQQPVAVRRRASREPSTKYSASRIGRNRKRNVGSVKSTRT